MRTSFETPQARTPQSQNNNFVPAPPAEEFAAPDMIAPDAVNDKIIIDQPMSEFNTAEPELTDAAISEIISDLNNIVSGLNTEIDALNSEIARCQKEKKTNTILTVVGGAGVLGTGIGAIVQGKKLHDAKKAGAVEKQGENGQDKKEASE